jgi:hypothetical protein
MWGRVVKIALSLPFLIVTDVRLYLVFGFFWSPAGAEAAALDR